MKRRTNPAMREMRPDELVAFERVVEAFGSKESAIDAINNIDPFTMQRRVPTPKRRKAKKRDLPGPDFFVGALQEPLTETSTPVGRAARTARNKARKVRK